MSVKVGVRVRPFNKRQEQLSCKKCIQMDGTTTHLINSYGEVKSFVYDYSFWSHDKFMVDPDGIFIPVDDKYADQRKVYSQIGADILQNAWNGYNCCLFAYGQTGSGKSYSMLGYGANKGIIPIVCDQIFEKIKNTKQKNIEYDVKVSMMEIYNEAIRDLLSKSKKAQLKICEHKKLGVYVEGLQKHSVSSYEEIQSKIDQGSNSRSVAATLMNESSSRSHTIVSIHFIQKMQITVSQTSFKYSTIHLVDLAGSQCVGKTGVDSKDRLRETAKINQSLSTLGRVIEILAQNASKIDKIFVPYRDSKLTFILRNALGGNSCTAMICAISPADDNYEETLSTLRYAHRAKKIQNKALVNESDVDKLIRMLREENQMLKKMLQEAKFTKTVINQQVISNVQEINRSVQGFGIQTEDDLLLQEIENEMFKQYSFSETNISESTGIDQKLPYITNISEDQQLTGRLKYSCVNSLLIGNKEASPKPDIVLATLGIQPNHAKIYEENGHVYIQSFSQTASEYTFINGENASAQEKKELFDLDRLIFGTGCVFLVKIFGGAQRKQGKEMAESDIDYTYALSEMQGQKDFQKSSKLVISEEEEIRKKILSEIQKEYEKEREENESILKTKIQEQEKAYEEKLKEMQKIKEEENEKLKLELQNQQKESLKLKEEQEVLRTQIIKFSQIQTQLEEKTHEKEELEENRKILEEKVGRMSTLESELSKIEVKEVEMKKEIQRQQEKLKKELQVKMVMCNNENILNEYKLELSKKNKNANEVKDLLVKKEKIELQKQLLELVPMVQKFNLIGRQMKKQVECGLSIRYKYISEVETVQVLKTGSYKNKLQIVIHVVNRKQKRSYNWSVQVFKHRFELALSLFQIFIKTPDDEQINDQNNDPYWDPPENQLIGISYISLQTLFYGLSFQGEISVVKHGQKLGTLSAKIFPTDLKGQKNLSEDVESGITLYNPKEWIQKTINFYVCLAKLTLFKNKYTDISIEYELYEKSYKQEKYLKKFENSAQFSYIQKHMIKELSEATILHHVDKPLSISFYGKKVIDNEIDDDELTVRGQSSGKSSFTSNFTHEQVMVQNFSESPIKGSKIVTNEEVMSKINLDYDKKMLEKKKVEYPTKKPNFPQYSKKSKDNCIIF